MKKEVKSLFFFSYFNFCNFNNNNNKVSSIALKIFKQTVDKCIGNASYDSGNRCNPPFLLHTLTQCNIYSEALPRLYDTYPAE